MAENEKDKLLREATALLMDIALNKGGNITSTQMERAAEFVAKAKPLAEPLARAA